MKKLLSLLVCLTLVLTMCLGLVSCNKNDKSNPDTNIADTNVPVTNVPDPNAEGYEKALILLANGDYTGAMAEFEKLGDYRDSEEYLSKFYYMPISFEYSLTDKQGIDDVFLDNRNLPYKQNTIRPDVQAVTSYVYDENGNIIKQIATKNGEQGPEVSFYEYTYNGEGQRIRADFEFYGGLSGFHTFTFDDNGNEIIQTYEDSDGYAYEYIIEYDDRGNITKLETVWDGGSDVFYVEYTYDETKLLKEVGTYSDGSMEVHDYYYDENGNRVAIVHTYADGTQARYDYIYDENGNIVKELFTNADGVEQYVIITYQLVYIPCGITDATEYFFRDLWSSRL